MPAVPLTLDASVASPLMVEVELDLSPIGGMTPEQFADFCGLNDGYGFRFELTADQKLVMSPNLGVSSAAHMIILRALARWQDEQGGIGYLFESSLGYKLKGGAVKAPDASWVSDQRWATYPADVLDHFLPGAPDFLVEVRSHSDRPKALRSKMLEWLANGARLAWLIDPLEQQALIYRAGHAEPQLVADFAATLSGEDVLPGFSFPLASLQAKR